MDLNICFYCHQTFYFLDLCHGSFLYAMYTTHTKKLQCLIKLYFVTLLSDKYRGLVTLIYEKWQKQRKTRILSTPIDKEDLDT